MNIITGQTGTPHVTAQQDRDIFAGILGDGMYVLPVGKQFEAEQQSGNTIRIKDGTLMLQGCAASIDAGSFEDVTIENGTQNMKRTDLIVAHYHLESSSGYEHMELRVIKGTPESSPQMPAYASGIIRDGAQDVDMPLYSVTLDGVTITTVTQLFTVMEHSLYELANAQKVLWNEDAGYYMNGGQTITLKEPISAQAHGIVLVFCRFNRDNNHADNSMYSVHFIPKSVVLFSVLGAGGTTFFNAGYSFNRLGSKYLYITDTQIRGNDYNSQNETSPSGITYDNRDVCLRWVLGV